MNGNKIMDKIESFKVNHLKLKSGLYVSRKDNNNGVTVTTFDMRFTAPNVEPCMKSSAIHTIEHLGATYFRNSNIKENIVYFGPMGCKTGFYLLIFGDLASESIYDEVINMCNFILNYSGDIPGATPIECGNYSLQDLSLGKTYVRKYKEDLENYKRFIYLD